MKDTAEGKDPLHNPALTLCSEKNPQSIERKNHTLCSYECLHLRLVSYELKKSILNCNRDKFNEYKIRHTIKWEIICTRKKQICIKRNFPIWVQFTYCYTLDGLMFFFFKIHYLIRCGEYYGWTQTVECLLSELIYSDGNDMKAMPTLENSNVSKFISVYIIIWCTDKFMLVFFMFHWFHKNIYIVRVTFSA